MERVFGPDDRKTPALTKADGVDYIPLPTWKIFMIQFLNIAGLGPIFGAIMGAKFGSSSYLWIVLGSIFAGAVHDYFAGMLSLRNGGESLPEIIGRYLGLTTKQVMRGFTVKIVHDGSILCTDIILIEIDLIISALQFLPQRCLSVDSVQIVLKRSLILIPFTG